jgi:integrase/recombinase XerC
MHLQEFLKYLAFEKRFSPLTVKAYGDDLQQFHLFLQAAYQTTDIAAVNHSMVRSWLVSLMENNIRPRSVNRKISALKTYYKYLLRQQVLTLNPMLKIVAPKTEKKLPQFVEVSKMDELLDELEFEAGFAGQRDKLILELFYATGMRLSELIGLREASIDFYENQLKVLGKRNKERLIPFAIPVREHLQAYLGLKSAQGLTNEHLFVSEKNRPLTPKQVYTLVKKYLGKVTTISQKSPHVLRHTFATHMLNNGGDLNAIKELLGHANLSATQVYTHNSIEKLKSAYKKAHPRGE